MRDELTAEEQENFARQIVLADIGYEGQIRLRDSRVCLVGLGGLGSPTALKLAGMGVGHMRLVDRDVVSRSDLHRQYLYGAEQVGRLKVEAAMDRLRSLNPAISLDAVPASLSTVNAEGIVEGMDVVIDGLDRPEPRYVLNRACAGLDVPYLFGGAVETYGNASTILPGRTACLECFMGGLKGEDLPLCGAVGVHPSILGIISAVQVSEAVRLLTDREPKLANRLLYFDLREFDFTIMKLRPSKKCGFCGEDPGGSRLPLTESYFEEVCARDGRRTFVVTPRDQVEIDVARLEKLLNGRGLPVLSSGPLEVTFQLSGGGTACLLKSGTMIVHGAAGTRQEMKENLLENYRELLVDGLGHSKSIVPSKE